MMSVASSTVVAAIHVSILRAAFYANVEMVTLWVEMADLVTTSTNVAVTTEVVVKSVLTHREGFSVDVEMVSH